MKKQISLVALCLCTSIFAHAQSTTTTNSSGSTSTTNSTSTDGTSTGTMNSGTTGTMNNSTSPTSSSYGTGSTNAGATTTGGTTTGTYSTNTGAGTTYGTTSTTRRNDKDYKNFVFGVYAGLNTTRFAGEVVSTTGNSRLTGRLGYQIGFFVRGGGRLYGQLGAEYFASSSNYFVAGSGQSATDIRDQINIKYIQVPVYVGYKLVESDRGISAVRLQVGLEYANQIGSTANDFGNLNNFEVKRGTFNGIGQLGFDAGPIFLDLTYHYGFSNAIQQNTGFAGSQRRILSASVGFKF